MMKFTVTTDGGVTENHAKISGDGRTLTDETVSILTDAFEILLEVILDDKRKS